MKKILVINGSPNKKGHTIAILNEVLQEINKEEINFINCYEMNIKPCIDCKYCSNVEGKCSIADDMSKIYKLIAESEVIILATPMYFGMFPSQLKALIDRCQVIWSEKYIFHKKNLSSKKGIFIFNGGDKWPNMFQPMQTIGKYFFNTINCSIDYELLISNIDNEKDYVNLNLRDISQCKSILRDII